MKSTYLLTLTKLLKRCKTTLVRPQSQLRPKKGISRNLEHFKIIGKKDFIKNKVNQEILIFGIFLAYRALNKIVWNFKTREEGCIR